MRIYLPILLFLSNSVFANEFELKQQESYTVPFGKAWVIDSAPTLECRVCTADIYVKGEISQVEVNGVIFNGTFEFSFTPQFKGTVKIYGGTELQLGDSRQTLTVVEQSD